MSDVHVIRRALRWDLTSSTFSSRAAVAEVKVRLDETTRVPDVVSRWRALTTGAETCLFALRQYETRSCLFVRQYEEHVDVLHHRCQLGITGRCTKCQLNNSISDFVDSCKRYQMDTPSYATFKGLASGLKSILTNAVEIGYPRSLFVRRTVDARANRPMKDMIHWVLYEELRFIMTGDQMESELQHQLNAFLGHQELDDRNLKVRTVEPIFKQNERVYRYLQEGYRDQYCILVELQLIVSDAARFNMYRYWWPIPGLALEPSAGQFCFYLGDKLCPSKQQHEKPGIASFSKNIHRNNARRTYIVWN